jgi:hypothetical protein
MAFLNFLPNNSAEFLPNKLVSSSKSKDSGEILTNNPYGDQTDHKRKHFRPAGLPDEQTQ